MRPFPRIRSDVNPEWRAARENEINQVAGEIRAAGDNYDRGGDIASGGQTGKRKKRRH